MKIIIFAVISCLLASAVFSADNTTTTVTTASTTNKSTVSTTATTAKSTGTSTAKTTATTAKSTATTTAKTTATTTAKTTATTTAKTTTVPTTTVAPPPTDIFELKENKTVCFLAKIAADFTVTYNKTDNTTGTAVIAIPKTGVTYKGKSACASDMIPDPYLTLEFEGYMAQFNFTQKGGVVYLQSVSFHYTEDPANFPNATDSKTPHSTSNDNVDLKMSSNTTFFQCNSPIAQTIDKAVTLTFDVLKVQVYDVKGNFSGEGEICAGDKKSTSTPMTSTVTPTPTPTLPATPNSGNWSVQGSDGKTCMVAVMGARFEIPYTKKDNATATAKFDVPADATTEGSTCGNATNSDTLQLDFFKNFVLKMIFTTVKASAMLTADDEYHLQNISLTYHLNEQQFPGHGGNPAEALMITNNEAHFKVSVGKSYKCKTKVEIDMGGDARLDTYNLQVEAFKTSNGTDFDESSECAADGTSGIVPIAVGAALAALVVIVLIAYIIGRRKRYQGYEAL
ncbi:lysosome-associated membrane glycoprotein 1-like isoform X2 [Lineus longissimus]|uniref:lysosome-associated membrane glycoprotein 1-like isoform X2 n=1 Tax=Lineus longissimus TaxID=88925 RepID=UPI002B4DF914